MRKRKSPRPPIPTDLIVGWLMAHTKYDGDECLTWPFRLNSGYGTFFHNGKIIAAHRMMCEIVNGPAPTPKHYATHTCGRGHLSCVHPKHIAWRTPSENQYDRATHGTKANGPRGKLTLEQVALVKSLKGQKTQAEIAAMVGVYRTTVSWIHRGLIHKDNPIRRNPRQIEAAQQKVAKR